MDAPVKAYESTAAESAQPPIPPENQDASDGSAGLDFPALAGLLSLLGDSDAHESDDHPASRGDDAAQLLRTLRPYLQNARLLPVDRAAMLLETARSVRGILHSIRPLLGDLSGGKK